MPVEGVSVSVSVRVRVRVRVRDRVRVRVRVTVRVRVRVSLKHPRSTLSVGRDLGLAAPERTTAPACVADVEHVGDHVHGTGAHV